MFISSVFLLNFLNHSLDILSIIGQKKTAALQKICVSMFVFLTKQTEHSEYFYTRKIKGITVVKSQS